MRWCKRAAAILVLLIAVVIGYGLAAAPLRCNLNKRQVQARALELMKVTGTINVSQYARTDVALIRVCLDACPTDAEMYTTVAADYRIMGRLDDAREVYERALRYERRPEIYYNLGLVQLDLNERNEGIASLTRACSFDLRLANRIPDPTVANVIVENVLAMRAREMHAVR